MVRMSKQRINEVLSGPRIARVGTIGPEGEPHVTPMWFVWDGESMYVIGRKVSSWIEQMRKNPRVAVLIDDDGPPEFKISIQGFARITHVDWVETGKKMVVKYFGDKIGNQYLEATLDQPRFLVKIDPKEIITWEVPPEKAAGKEGWHPRYYEPGSKWYKEYQLEKKAKSK